MVSVIKSIAGIIPGVAIFVVVFVVGEALSAVLHPFPDDFNNTMEEVIEHVAKYPGWILALFNPDLGTRCLRQRLDRQTNWWSSFRRCRWSLVGPSDLVQHLSAALSDLV